MSIADCGFSGSSFLRAKNPTNYQPDQRAADIDHRVARRRCARRQKRLMEFVASREDRAGKQDQREQDRNSRSKAFATAKRSPKQSGEDGVFSQVSEFPNDGVNRV